MVSQETQEESMKNVSVVAGAYLKIPADVLIVGTSSKEIYDVIRGNHDGPLQKEVASHEWIDGETMIVEVIQPGSALRNIVYVVDDLKLPLHEIVLAGLEEANKWKDCITVSLLPIRMDATREGIAELKRGVEEFFARHHDSPTKITLVVPFPAEVCYLLALGQAFDS
ncbi:MAG: hypothetical protein Q7R62_03805 [bacterium]|nr:hypothetical protein [bacterium]